jgi:hypothetical protein
LIDYEKSVLFGGRFFMASAIGAIHATCAKRLVFANGEGVVGGGLAAVANEK